MNLLKLVRWESIEDVREIIKCKFEWIGFLLVSKINELGKRKMVRYLFILWEC